MILVTGASGLLGASLIAVAREQGREVVGLCYRHAVRLPGGSLIAVDLTQESETRKIFENIKPTIVIHCAAETNVDFCQENPETAYAINVVTSRMVADITAQAGTRMLYISTDSVFDGARGWYSETDQPAPVNVYARTKLQGEQEVLARNAFATVARINLYGWNVQPNKKSLAEWILDELLLGNVVPGFTDVVFSPILASDLAALLLAIVDRNLTGLYHVAGSEPVSKYEFARRVALMFGFDPARVVPARLAESRLKAPRPRDTSLNTQKISAALGSPMPDVDSGLSRFAEMKSAYAERFRSMLAGVRP
jgi:dTDP-4-dehydrorhamnose reductase